MNTEQTSKNIFTYREDLPFRKNFQLDLQKIQSDKTPIISCVYRKTLIRHQNISCVLRLHDFSLSSSVKQGKIFQSQHIFLFIIDTFKGHDNKALQDLSQKNNCEVVMPLSTLTKKFQLLDVSVQKSVKNFIQNKYHDGFARKISSQLQNRKRIKMKCRVAIH